jgi:hypothetical protein
MIPFKEKVDVFKFGNLKGGNIEMVFAFHNLLQEYNLSQKGVKKKKPTTNAYYACVILLLS